MRNLFASRSYLWLHKLHPKKLLFRNRLLYITGLSDRRDLSKGQKEYIEAGSGAGMATSSREVCDYCDEGRHNECSTASKCYCAKNGHRML